MNVEAATTNSFNYLIKIPPTYIRAFQKSVLLAIEELQIDEKTKNRDALDLQVEEKLPHKEILGDYYECVKGNKSSASYTLKSRLEEIQNLQYIIDEAEKSISIEHVDSRICQLEGLMQLEEGLIQLEEDEFEYEQCELNQLKRRREMLSSLIGREEEDEGIRQIREVKHEAEESLKIVRKEIEILKDSDLEAKATEVKFRKKNDDAMEQLEELQRQYGVAARVCEEAIANKETIEKSYLEKMSLLRDCGSNAVLAHSYVASADRMGLSRYCKNNVEKFMKWWNKDEEFRREYARFNESLDGARSSVDDYKERAKSSNKHGSKKCKRNNRNKN